MTRNATSLVAKIFFFVVLAAIEYLALSPSPPKIHVFSIWDKANHFAAFALLYVTFCLGFGLNFLKRALILIAVGVQIEVVQAFLPNRYFSFLDVVADGVGIVFAALFLRMIRTAFGGKFSF